MAHGCPGDGQYEVAHLGAASGDQMNGGYPLAILVAARHIWGQAKGAVVAALAGQRGWWHTARSTGGHGVGALCSGSLPVRAP